MGWGWDPRARGQQLLAGPSAPSITRGHAQAPPSAPNALPACFLQVQPILFREPFLPSIANHTPCGPTSSFLPLVWRFSQPVLETNNTTKYYTHVYKYKKYTIYTIIYIYTHYHHRPRLWAETNRTTLRHERVLFVCPRW